MKGEGVNDVAFMLRRCIIDGIGCLFLEGLPWLEWERIWAPMEACTGEIEAGRAVTVSDCLLTSSRLVFCSVSHRSGERLREPEDVR